MSAFEHTKAPLISHLTELKRRLCYVVLVFLGASVAAYLFADVIYQFLLAPLKEAYGPNAGRKLIYTNLTEAFFTYLRLACFGGAFLAVPFAAWQIYLFIAPGLYRHEKRVIYPYLVFSPLLFVAGAALAYYMVFPLAWEFFLSFETQASPDAQLPIQLEARVGEYLSLAMQFMVGFGIAFQLPVLLTLLVRAGLISTQTLKSQRRLAIVLIFLASAILTPPDILSQISLAIPLLLLYEISLLLCKRMEGLVNRA